MVVDCEFNSTKLNDIEYIRSYHYNKREYVTFRSSVGKFVGYTENGVFNAKNWNNGPVVVQMRAEKESYCLPTVGIDEENALTKSGESVSVCVCVRVCVCVCVCLCVFFMYQLIHKENLARQFFF